MKTTSFRAAAVAAALATALSITTVAQQESAEVPEGNVLQQLRKGYRFRERLLRPATVIVAKKPAA